MSEMYIIWSEEHGAWWLPFGSGYTHSIAKAGRYTKEKAAEILFVVNKYVHSESGINGERKFNEIAIPDPML